MYFQLHFFFLLYTTVLLIVHVDQCRYSVRYFYHTIMKQSLYSRARGSLFCTPLGVPGIYRFRVIFINMNDLPFTSTQDNNMFDIIKTKYSSNHYTYYLGTNNYNLFHIDPDLNITYNVNKRRCQNFETTVDFNSKYGSENNIAFLHSNISSSEKKIERFVILFRKF